MNWLKIIWSIMAALLTGPPGPETVPRAMEKARDTVPMAEVSRLTAEIEINMGDLSLQRGDTGLMDAFFMFNNPRLKPEMTFARDAGTGRIHVHQPLLKGSFRNARCEFDMRVSDGPPLDLAVHTGSGDIFIDGRNIRMRHGTIRTGAGDVTLTCGTGTPVQTLSVESGAGELSLDVGGERVCNLDLAVRTGAGDVKLILPKDAGLTVETAVRTGSIKAAGFKRVSNTFMNDLHGISPVTVTVHVSIGTGDLLLATR